MTDIPQSTIDELRRLSKAATPGPWNAPDDGSKYGAVMVFSGETDVADCSGPFREIGKELCNTNAALIAALRNNIDALLDALETARANERRYLWLRDNHSQTYGMHIDGMAGYRMHGVLHGHFTSLDAAIDAAIAATEVKHG